MFGSFAVPARLPSGLLQLALGPAKPAALNDRCSRVGSLQSAYAVLTHAVSAFASFSYPRRERIGATRPQRAAFARRRSSRRAPAGFFRFRARRYACGRAPHMRKRGRFHRPENSPPGEIAALQIASGTCRPIPVQPGCIGREKLRLPVVLAAALLRMDVDRLAKRIVGE